MSLNYAVDIPNSDDPENAWVNMGFFDTRDEAIKWCKETLGADDEGRIRLVSQVSDDWER